MRIPRPSAISTSLVIASSLLLLLAACGTAQSDPAADGEGAEPLALAGTSWTLVSYADVSGAAVEATASPESGSLAFDTEGRFSGSTGCNRIAGTYEQDGLSLAMNPGRMSMMACTGPVAAQEAAVLAAFAQVTTFAADGQLLLLGPDGSTLLTYDPTLTELAGTSWQATGINNGKEAVVSQAGTESVTAVFGTDGQVSGTGGCNEYSGTFTTGDGNTLIFGAIAATARACADPAIDEIEANYFAALPKVTTYEVEADRLTLRDATGATQVTYTRTS